MGFSKQEYWSGLPCSPPGDIPHPGIKPTSLMSLALASRFFTSHLGSPEANMSYQLLRLPKRGNMRSLDPKVVGKSLGWRGLEKPGSSSGDHRERRKVRVRCGQSHWCSKLCGLQNFFYWILFFLLISISKKLTERLVHPSSCQIIAFDF